MFLLPTAQMGEVWDPSEKQRSIGITGALVMGLVQFF
jgi:hypothetical protein